MKGYQEAIDQLERKYETGARPTSYDEIRFIFKNISCLGKGYHTIVELGTFRGFTVQMMAYGLATLEKKHPTEVAGEIYTCDLNSSPDFLSEYEKHITFKQEDSIKMASQFRDDSIDFLYIDTIHTYEQTRKEIEAYYPKMKDGHCFCGHNYTPHKVRGRQVIRAVEAWKTENANKWIGFGLKHRIWWMLKDD